MKHDINILLNQSLMSNTPIIFVEGIDDVKIYETIKDKYLPNKQLDFLPIETVGVLGEQNTDKAYKEGSEGVRKCISDLQPKFQNDIRLFQYVLGIIDRDVLFYRNEVPTSQGLLMLRYYSIESYFVNHFTLKNAIALQTNCNVNKIEQSVIDFVENTFHEHLPKLYYVSLEALKNASDIDYSSIAGYKDDSLGVPKKSEFVYNQIESKKQDLDIFAQSQNIDIQDYKLIVKGKWLLYHYAYLSKYQLEKLYEKDTCKGKSNEVAKCRYCDTNDKKCEYKVISSYNPQQIYENMLSNPDATECDDIIKKLANLA